MNLWTLTYGMGAGSIIGSGEILAQDMATEPCKLGLLQIDNDKVTMRPRVRFLALLQFKMSIRSETGSSKPRKRTTG